MIIEYQCIKLVQFWFSSIDLLRDAFLPVSDMHTTVCDNTSPSHPEPLPPVHLPSLAASPLAIGTVRVGAYIAVPALLREFGFDPACVVAEFGLNLSIFDEPDNRIAYSTAVKLLTRCAAITRCEHFGLLAGQHIGPTAMGLIGYLVLHSPSVELALQQLVENKKLHGRGCAVRLAIYRDQVALAYTPNVAPEYAEQISYGALAMAFNILRKLCGDAWLPTEVRFALPAPRDIHPFRRFFKAPVHFNAEQSMLVFSRRWLGCPVSGADPILFRLLQKVADNLRRNFQDNVAGDVRNVIMEQLPTGKCSIEIVSERLDMHPRTLNRRLKEQGTSFIRLLTEIRRETATQLLRESGLSVTRIGLMLGYNSASSFTRSFERMTGRSPKAWRTDHNEPSQP